MLMRILKMNKKILMGQCHRIMGRPSLLLVLNSVATVLM